MPSSSLLSWQSRSSRVLDQIEAAHKALGGGSAGGRFAAQQVNHAYVVMLCSQFQKFSRDLHTECINYLTAPASPPDPRVPILRNLLVGGRKLDFGNPNPGNLGSDFGRFGIDFWLGLSIADPQNRIRQRQLEQVCNVRNAVAHQDFNPAKIGKLSIRLADVRRWRQLCDELAIAFDRVMGDRLAAIMGNRPW